MSRIVVCCDGTYQSRLDASTRATHVFRLEKLILAETELHKTQQHRLFINGIGTEQVDPFRRHGAVVGRGIEDKIKQGYHHICLHYKSSADQIILIGYSRGAFVVRCIADIITKVGILANVPSRPGDIAAVYEGWKTGDRSVYSADVGTSSKHIIRDNAISATLQSHPEQNKSRFLDLLRDGESLRRQVRVDVCAVWDTVAAIGYPDILTPPRPPKDFDFMTSDLDDRIDHFFQALALHEHRKGYIPIVFRTEGSRNTLASFRQCWFMGYHGDMGGGRSQEALSFLPLIWMIDKIKSFVEIDFVELKAMLQDREKRNPSTGWWAFRPDHCTCDGACDYLMCNVQSSNRNSPTLTLKRIFAKQRSQVVLNGNSTRRYRAVLNTSDSMKHMYHFHGSKYRKPRRQFWTKSHLEEIEPARHTNLSNEVMHWTVRLFKEGQIYPLPEPLRDAAVDKIATCDCHPHKHNHQWRIYLESREKNHYHVCEDDQLDSQDKYPDNELRMVATWLEAELDHLQETAEENHGSPETFITELLVDIQNVRLGAIGSRPDAEERPSAGQLGEL